MMVFVEHFNLYLTNGLEVTKHPVLLPAEAMVYDMRLLPVEKRSWELDTTSYM